MIHGFLFGLGFLGALWLYGSLVAWSERRTLRALEKRIQRSWDVRTAPDAPAPVFQVTNEAAHAAAALEPAEETRLRSVDLDGSRAWRKAHWSKVLFG